jgi:hypothetical protein
MNIESQLTLNQKLEEATAGLTPQYIGRLKNKVSRIMLLPYQTLYYHPRLRLIFQIAIGG